MTRLLPGLWRILGAALLVLGLAAAVQAAPAAAGVAPPAKVLRAGDGFASMAQKETAQAIRIALGLTVLALLPAMLVCMTSFLRIAVVLSMLRHALGMPETPPTPVLLGLALFLTLFTMAPALQKVEAEAFQPFMNGQLDVEAASRAGMQPLREFMLRQTREQDLALVVELSRAQPPDRAESVGNLQLVPAFMLSELRTSFQISALVLLPFLLIDLIVSAILMALGAMVLPPATISLPLKVLVFVLVDGWALLLRALMGSFH